MKSSPVSMAFKALFCWTILPVSPGANAPPPPPHLHSICWKWLAFSYLCHILWSAALVHVVPGASNVHLTPCPPQKLPRAPGFYEIEFKGNYLWKGFPPTHSFPRLLHSTSSTEWFLLSSMPCGAVCNPLTQHLSCCFVITPQQWLRW